MFRSKQSMMDEKAELDNRIEQMRKFISEDFIDLIVVSEVNRMKKQLEYMEGYSKTLGERIADYDTP